MIEQYTSPVAVNNSQEPWLVGEGVVVSGGVAIPSLDFNFITGGLPGTVTFTRGSNATQFDSSGNLVYAPANLLVRSEDFATTWSALNVTPSTDTSLSPAGTLTADTLTPAASTAAHLISQSVTVTASTAYSASVFVKTDGAPFVQIAYDNGASVGAFINVNLSTGAITRGPELAGGATNVTGTVIALGDGYYRISVGATHTGTTGRVLISPLPAGQSAAGLNPSTTTAATDKIIVWGAQLNPTFMLGGVTASLSTYYPTTTTAYYGPRFDYNPTTLAARGLLIEEQRTNSIRNNTMQGAVAGTPGTAPTNWLIPTPSNGLSRQIVGTGTENGINYIDVRYSGTTSAASLTAIYWESATQVAAASGQTWTNSVYVALVGGSTANTTSVVVGIDENNGAGGFLAGSSTAFVPSAGALTGKRVSHTRTLTNASTAFVWPYVFFSYGNGVAIDITLRIGLPQLEQGAFATSVIPTTTTALTRNADVASVNTLSPWYNATEGTIYAELQVPALGASGNPSLYSLNTDSSNRIFLFVPISSSNYRAQISTLGATELLQNIVSVANITDVNKTAFAYATNNSVAYGRNTNADDTSCAIPVVNKLEFGSSAGFTKYIRRITYYPRRLSNAELQAITA